MSLGHSPSIVTSGLALCLDAANYKSFKGVNATNILTTVSYAQSNQSSSVYKVSNGEEVVYIPALGTVTSKYVDFYNDYSGGSGQCCPSLYNYGSGLAVSPSTTYTYSIIYKTTTGYSHPNYMYRYEYTNTGAYAGEAGVHSTSNRTSLGGDWWFAWGQFTTGPSTVTLSTHLFHYEYATPNRVYVYRAALYQGTYIIPPEHMLTSGQVRGTTVATGGGWADLTGSGNNGELVNGPIYNSSNGGSLVFDGTNDYISIPNSVSVNPGTGSFTIIVWVNSDPSNAGDGWDLWVAKRSNGSNGYYLGVNNPLGVRFMVGNDANSRTDTGYLTYTYNTWAMYTAILDRNTNTQTIIKNKYDEVSTVTPSGGNYYNTNPLSIGGDIGLNSFYVNGRVSSVAMYAKALTAAEVNQNFNAFRGRFGV